MSDECKCCCTSKCVNEESLALDKFEEKVLKPYLSGQGETGVQADALAARSLIPPLTAWKRSFSFIATEMPDFVPEKCIGCLECVMECPDAAIYPRIATEEGLETALAKVEDAELKSYLASRFTKTVKFYKGAEKKGLKPGLFSIWIDPDRCKGCGECAYICSDRGALNFIHKTEDHLAKLTKSMQWVRENLPDNPEGYANEKMPADIFLSDKAWLYRGGAGSCSGCGEITTLKMAITAAAAKYGNQQVMICATGCNSVYGATYPFSIFNVPWTNPLFENAATTALGVRLRLDQVGRQDVKVWAVGGDGAMADIGFQPVSRVLASGADVNILMLDTQVYSNTGGQASTATFTGQNAKMSAHGKAVPGKTEARKELAMIAMMHPDTYVAQVSAAYYNHFIKAVQAALEFKGPSLIITYSPCMPEHNIADNLAFERSKAAVVSRAFPLFTYDPRKGESFKERLDLQGNPSPKEDWHTDAKSGQLYDFIWFAKEEGRFAKHFDKQGNPSDTLLRSKADRLQNWRRLQELAGVK